MEELKPYLERLKYTDTTTDTYLYSTKTNVAINEQGKIDSSGISRHILNGLSSTSTSGTIKLVMTSSSSYQSFAISKNNDLYA